MSTAPPVSIGWDLHVKNNTMPTYQLKKLSRGEYQVIRPNGTDYFSAPVSKHKASQAILDERVHERFLVDIRIKKAIHKFINNREIEIDSVDRFIYQYSYKLGHREMREMMKRPALFIEYIDKTMASDQAARQASRPTDKYASCNHHHELTDDYQLVDFGDGEFVANKAAVPLLAALNAAGLRTRTHHYTGEGDAFVSILLEGVRVEVREVNEGHSDRTKYNGKMELLIMWKAVRV